MLQEFRKFILRGNVIDLAVGIIMGTAFGAIVKSLVDDIIMPPIGLILGGVNFADLFVNLTPSKPATSLAAAREAGAAVVAYGSFFNNIINFLIIAFVIFLLVRAVNRMMQAKAEAPTPPVPTAEEKLLTEIRDLLKTQRPR